MKILSALIVSVIFSGITHGQNFLWAKSMGGVNDDFGYSITVDVNGNIFTTGRFEATADFDPGPGTFTLSSGGGADVFVSKLDPNGNFLWAKSFGSPIGDDEGRCIVTDLSGNCYLTGLFCWTVDFDPSPNTFTLASAGVFDAFVVKLDANGGFVWANKIGGKQWDNGNSIVLDSFGNSYSTGYFRDTVDFDPGINTFTLCSGSNGSHAFINKLDVNGNFVWVKQIGGSTNSSAEGISMALDVSGNIYTTGDFSGTVDFDPSPNTFTLMAGYSTFASKLDLNGNFIWAKQFTSYGASSIRTESIGNVYITRSSGDMVIYKLDSNGNTVWTKTIGGPDMEKVRSSVVDNLGNIYIIGDFNGTVDFDPGPNTYTLTTIGSFDIFIIKLDGNGNLIGVIQLGGPWQDFGYGIACDGAGDICSTGFFSETADFDPSSGVFNLTSSPSGWHDVFVHKMGKIVGLNEYEFENVFELFPNPTSGRVRCLFSNNITCDYKVTDVTGKLLKEGSLNGYLNEINLSGLSKGLYFVTISDKGHSQTKRIVLE
ncbi:MAG: SBBP repeat-containing protein [Sphingobacteriaceae bacterium]|nr:SBBP repeat-containing protein [Sphingobacteriaceae bacterium]